MNATTRLKKMLDDVVLDKSNTGYRCKFCDFLIPIVPVPMETEAWVAALHARCLGHMVEHFIEQERANK